MLPRPPLTLPPAFTFALRLRLWFEFDRDEDNDEATAVDKCGSFENVRGVAALDGSFV